MHVALLPSMFCPGLPWSALVWALGGWKRNCCVSVKTES